MQRLGQAHAGCEAGGLTQSLFSQEEQELLLLWGPVQAHSTLQAKRSANPARGFYSVEGRGPQGLRSLLKDQKQHRNGLAVPGSQVQKRDEFFSFGGRLPPSPHLHAGVLVPWLQLLK